MLCPTLPLGCLCLGSVHGGIFAAQLCGSGVNRTVRLSLGSGSSPAGVFVPYLLVQGWSRQTQPGDAEGLLLLPAPGLRERWACGAKGSRAAHPAQPAPAGSAQALLSTPSSGTGTETALLPGLTPSPEPAEGCAAQTPAGALAHCSLPGASLSLSQNRFRVSGGFVSHQECSQSAPHSSWNS